MKSKDEEHSQLRREWSKKEIEQDWAYRKDVFSTIFLDSQLAPYKNLADIITVMASKLPTLQLLLQFNSVSTYWKMFF